MMNKLKELIQDYCEMMYERYHAEELANTTAYCLACEAADAASVSLEKCA